MNLMSVYRAIVHEGRAVIENLDEYPDGTELEFALIEDDDLDEDERRELDTKLEASWEQAQRGETISGDDVAAKLRARR